MTDFRWPIRRTAATNGRNGSGWLILSVLLLLLASLRFAYHAAAFVEPLDRLRMGAWQ
ncbi:MAG: hypothetical protein JW940_00030 [Polyangiaceae bacterium]|nr:hypothetical protein [Polyangiaceae bacterium]